MQKHVNYFVCLHLIQTSLHAWRTSWASSPCVWGTGWRTWWSLCMSVTRTTICWTRNRSWGFVRVFFCLICPFLLSHTITNTLLYRINQQSTVKRVNRNMTLCCFLTEYLNSSERTIDFLNMYYLESNMPANRKHSSMFSKVLSRFNSQTMMMKKYSCNVHKARNSHVTSLA